MKTILLVRHATHAEVRIALSGRSEIALNARGRAEATRLANMLAGTPVASFHSSPRRRALETIAPVMAGRTATLNETAALDEIDFGSFAGRSFAALAGDADWDRWNRERATARCPDGETMREAVRRARTYLDALAPEDCPALCVTHCDIIRGLVTDGLGLALDRLFLFGCDPASVMTIELESARMRLVSLNAPCR